MTHESLIEAWSNFHALSGGISRPDSEDDYVQLLGFMDYLTDNYDCNQPPFASLFDLVAGYAHDWEVLNEPDLKMPVVAPHEMLGFLMEQQGVSQYQLARECNVDQGNLSRILSGKSGISKELAKRLAERFTVSVELLL